MKTNVSPDLGAVFSDTRIKFLRQVLILAVGICLSPTCFGQASEHANLISAVDQDLTIHRAGVIPVTDNVDGIYARPVETHLNEIIRDNHLWDAVEVKTKGQTLTAAELERDPETIKQIAQAFSVDALVASRVVRNGNSVSITLDLFLGKDGLLFLQEEVKNSPRSDVKDILKQLDDMMKKILLRMPYAGIVMSRAANRVTLNVGARDQVKEGQILSAALIISLQRHPKFHFYVSSEKEIIGRIRIDKVEPTLSFGTIVSERERGIVRKDSKILSLEFVSYEPVVNGLGQTAVTDDPEKKLAFGEKPNEWLPATAPTFGRVGVKFGLGSTTYSTALQTEGTIQGQASIFPQLGVMGEIWINPQWIVRLDIRYGIMSFSNPLTGSTPSTLNVFYSHYGLYGGYNFLLRDDFFGPKIQLIAGLDQTGLAVDTSTPVGLTSTSYSGLALGGAAEFPVNLTGEKDKYSLGIALLLHLSPSLSESPVSSGASASNSITQFSIYGSSKMNERLRAVASLDFDFYSTTFSGMGTRQNVADSATTSSQRITTLNGGVEWAF